MRKIIKPRKIFIPVVLLGIAFLVFAETVFAWFYREVPIENSGLGFQSNSPDFEMVVSQYNESAEDKWEINQDEESGAYLLRIGGFSFLDVNKSYYYRFTLINNKPFNVFASVFYYIGTAEATSVIGNVEYENIVNGDMLFFSVSDGSAADGGQAAGPAGMAWMTPRTFSAEASGSNPNYIEGQGSFSGVHAQFFVNTDTELLAQSQTDFFMKVDYNDALMWDILKTHGEARLLRVLCPLFFRGYATSAAIRTEAP